MDPKAFVLGCSAIGAAICTLSGLGSGLGQGIAAGKTAGAIFEIGATTAGNHTLYIRALDETGSWSITHSISFLTIDISQIEIAGVTAAEWFFDKDPGFGKANSISALPTGMNVSAKFNIQIPNNLGAGIHTFYVRALNAQDVWSVTQYNQFIVVDKPLQINAVAIEYFIDKDPGFGKAVSKTLASPGLSATELFFVNIDTLSVGAHSLYIRALDELNRWSITQSIDFYIVEITALPDVVAVEYFIDEDPGFGGGLAVSGITAGNMVTKTFAVSLQDVASGPHILYIRALDSRGKWSITQFEAFVKASARALPNLTAMEYFIDNDLGFGKATRLNINPSDTEYEMSFIVPANELSPGMHTLYIRALNDVGDWSVTQSIDLLVLDMEKLVSSKVAAIEHFFNVDKGFGKGQMTYVTPALMVERTFFISTSQLAEGLHTLYVRAINEDGSWSVTQYGSFVKVNVPKRAKDIVRIEYFVLRNEDLGKPNIAPEFGKGKPIPVSPDASVTKIFEVDLSDIVSDADKMDPNFAQDVTLFIRALDSGGEWAITHTIERTIANMPTVDENNWPKGGIVTPEYTEICLEKATSVRIEAKDFALRVAGWQVRVIGYDGTVTAPWPTDNSVIYANQPIIYFTPSAGGTYEFRALIMDGSKGPEYSPVARVVVIPPAVGGNVEGLNVPEFLCVGGQITLNLQNYIGNVTQWEYRLKGSGVWLTLQGAVGDLITAITPEGGTWEYRAKVADKCSDAYSSVYEVKVISSLTGGIVTPAAITVCEGNNFELTVSDYLGHIIAWQRSDDGGLTWTNIPFIQDIYNTTLAGTATVYYRAVVSAGNCETTYSQPAIVTTIAGIGAAGAIDGQEEVCVPLTSGIRYRIEPISGVDRYEWTLPTGAYIVGDSTGFSIQVAFGDNAQSGYISVKGVNDNCGGGKESRLYIEVKRSVVTGPIYSLPNM